MTVCFSPFIFCWQISNVPCYNITFFSHFVVMCHCITGISSNSLSLSYCSSVVLLLFHCLCHYLFLIGITHVFFYKKISVNFDAIIQWIPIFHIFKCTDNDTPTSSTPESVVSSGHSPSTPSQSRVLQAQHSRTPSTASGTSAVTISPVMPGAEFDGFVVAMHRKMVGGSPCPNVYIYG